MGIRPMRLRRSRATSAGSSPRWTDSCRADRVCERRSVGASSSCSPETSISSPARWRTALVSTTNLVIGCLGSGVKHHPSDETDGWGAIVADSLERTSFDPDFALLVSKHDSRVAARRAGAHDPGLPRAAARKRWLPRPAGRVRGEALALAERTRPDLVV